jgi:Tubulin like
VRRFLVIGCGGSGGATLAYLMDQLRSDLAALGVAKLPRAWQFVHVDVPHTPEPGPSGLGNVEEQGGTYVGAGPATANYKVLDDAVSKRLAEGAHLDAIGTWAPRDPTEVLTPIAVGAGQFRAVGRMITLSRATAIRAALEGAWNQLNHPDTRAEMRAVRAPLLQGNDETAPIVLVVSSMAGGAGASMALDVCRLLTSFPGPDANLVGVFMVAPNIFDALPEASRRGVRPNALAMLGEIVASQTGAARPHDKAALEALGVAAGGKEDRRPFARVFPVGRFAGTDRTQFGDGSPNAVYRGLGRGLAGMMMSPTATMQFQSYDLGNTAAVDGERDLMGWGSDWESLLWGSYGYASLSMGRDRYAEYSAQRIAGSCVDRLLNGHKQPYSRATSLEQVETLLDSQWTGLCNRSGLPASDAEVAGWLHSYAVPADAVARETTQTIRRYVEPQIPLPRGQAEQWVTALRQRLRDLAPQLTGAVETIATQRVYAWHGKLRDAVEREVAASVAGIGLPYATAAVERLARHVQNLVAPGAERIAAGPRPNLATVPDEVEPTLGRLRGTLTGGEQIVQALLAACQQNLRKHVEARSAELVAALVRQFAVEVLEPLRKALSEVQVLLERASTAAAVDLGLARLSTDQPIAWPRDDDERVPDRFDEADNEVLLTSSADFPAQYVSDMQRAVGDQRYFQDARAAVVASVVAGVWKTAGGEQAPGGLLEATSEWRPSLFPFHPETRAPIIPTQAAYDVHVRPPEVLGRARMFVGRRGESFDDFCRLSITDYVKGVGASEAEVDDRRRAVVAKFAQALGLARPLISVNNTALQAVHRGQSIEYRYKFSEVPFRDVSSVAEEFVRVLRTSPMIDAPSVDNLVRANGDTPNITRIDVFGSYPNYSPLVFDAVLGPVAEQWARAGVNGREDFWRWRRSRPLAAALPMGDDERRTMVAGWLLGHVIGRIRIPAAPYDKAVQVFDATRREWVAFPHPLLTPPDRFEAPYDWLPAVLESVLLAVARSHEAPVMASLRPYRVLRHIYDSSTEKKAGGIKRRDVAGRKAATDWLAGVRAGEGVSAVAGVTPESSVDERAKLATGWLTEIRALAGAHYMAAGEESEDPAAAPGGGVFSEIRSREQASRTPLFRDLAPDVFWATGQLIGLIDECREEAQRPRPLAEPPSWPDPHREELEIPPGPGQNF